MYVRVQYPKVQAFDNNGNFAVGYYIYTFVAGTTTAATTYSDRGLSVANTNPIVLDSRGEADIYIDRAIKLVFTIPGGAPTSPIWVVDYVGEFPAEILDGDGVSDAYNNYAVTVVPAVTSLTNRMMLIVTPDADSQDTMVIQPGNTIPTVFSGTGINDCVFSGPYTGTTAGSIFTVQIDGVSTFKWKKNGGAWVTGVTILGNNETQALIEGISVTFATGPFHTLGDAWSLKVMTPATVNLSGLGAKLVYKNVAGTLKVLSGGDLKKDIPATLVYSIDQDCWVLNNPSTAVEEAPALAVRYRKEIYTDYEMTAEDAGNVISCNGALTVTLPTAPEGANKFFYIKKKTTGDVTINSQGYSIYGLGSTGGANFGIGGSIECIQLESNGIDWEIITAVVIPGGGGGGSGHGTQSFYSPGAVSWVCPAGIFSVSVAAQAAGGGGAGCAGATDNGGGGGSGGDYATGSLPVTPGQPYYVFVGSGGDGGGSGHGAGYDGGNSFMLGDSGTQVFAAGGSGGLYDGRDCGTFTCMYDRAPTGNGGRGRGCPDDVCPTTGDSGGNGYIILTW